MEANNFIMRLKADGTENDCFDLKSVSCDYKTILQKCGTKDRGPFSLNVLCMLCRNIDKVPSWRENVDNKVLVSLSIDCVRETRNLGHADLVKALACIFHLHKHCVKLDSNVAPNLILKLSYLPFDNMSLLKDYCKTYWNIVADRILYIEKIRVKHSVTILLPRLVEDTLKVIDIYDSIQLCKNVLTFLVKKLHFLYNDSCAKELNEAFCEIFKRLSAKEDLKAFKKLPEKDLLELYMKFNECFYVVAENAIKSNFDCSVLNVAIRTCITLLGHDSKLMRCLETYFLNGFCSILENNTNASNTENILNNIIVSCKNMESGYEKVMHLTYSYLNQFMRLYLEFVVSNVKNFKPVFNESIQISCLNLMLLLGSKKSEQLIKCDKCKVRTSLHDSLRLLFNIKHFPNLSIEYNIDLTETLPIYYKLVKIQHKILSELKRANCANHEKCFRKLQTDIHNTAISLNKAKYFEYSIKLFNVYLDYEFKYFKQESDLKNISRALYNKSICELDYVLYEEALSDAFLSLIFSLPESLSMDKHLSLVMDIKAKSVKASEENQDVLQTISIIDACHKAIASSKYGNLQPFFSNLKASELLLHEFTMYANLWPSIVPIAGVWKSLSSLLRKDHPTWIQGEDEQTVLRTICSVVIQTCGVVRTVHNDAFSEVISELVTKYDCMEEKSTEQDLMHAAVLFVKCEYNVAAASQKYEWKTRNAEPSSDPDQVIESVKTILQEHEASSCAVKAVNILTRAVKNIGAVPKTKWLSDALRLYQVYVEQLLQLSKVAQALQLAHDCCELARYLTDGECFLLNASVLLAHAHTRKTELTSLIEESVSLWSDVSLEMRLCFLCDTAIYYNKIGEVSVASRLVRLVQMKILAMERSQSDTQYEIAVGRLLEAQARVCADAATLSCKSTVQRHYLAITHTDKRWSHRRRASLHTRRLATLAGGEYARMGRALLLWRRARGAAAACASASAVAQAQLVAWCTNTHSFQEAQVKIDNRLKYTLGLQQSNETQTHQAEPAKPQLFTPRLENLETMLENMVFNKTHISPSLPCTSVYAFKLPDFFKHDKCDCALCDNPFSFVIACTASALEASTYFRAKETQIAANYFEGALKSFGYAESKLRLYFKGLRSRCAGYIVDMIEQIVADDLKLVQIDVLLEAAYFELSKGDLEKADDLVIRIHEVMQEIPSLSLYVKNELYNLMCTSAQLRKGSVKKFDVSLERDMESLKISPSVQAEAPKTPISKLKSPPKIPKIIVNADELPNVKRKVIKLNLDDDEKEVVKSTRKRATFKIPVPVTSKPVPEAITPCHRTKPDIVVTKPPLEVDMTPKCNDREFSTPLSTPAEQFFTPMSSIRTYSKQSLRNNIVKNLEAEFSTPKTEKEKSTLTSTNGGEELFKSARSSRTRIDKKSLKRATSPGKLEARITRNRTKNPNLKVFEDK